MMKVPLKFVLICALVAWVVPVVPAQGHNDEAMARYAQAGRKALAAGDYGEARSNFEKAVQLEPNIAELHATLAAICFQQRDYERSMKEARAALKLKPALPRVDSLLGLSMAELGQYKDALPRLEKGFKQTADKEVRRMCGLQLLRAYSTLGRDADAVETALQLNKLYPDDDEVLYHTGRIYGNFAYVTMEKLHDAHPNSIWMLQAQGEANESMKDWDSALVAYNHVLQIDAHRPGIHYRIGRVYLRRWQEARRAEDRDAAKREFNAELETDPGNGNASYELAQMAADDNNLDEARTRFEQLTQRLPDFEQALVGLGGVYLQSRASEKAIEPLERATKIDAGDEVAWYRLAQAQRAAGKRDDAQKSLEKFRTLHAASSASRKPPSEEITAQQLGADAQP